MGSSIQDYAKKINSRLSFFDCMSILITTVFILLFSVFLYNEKKNNDIPVSYIVNEEGLNSIVMHDEVLPFASINGKTYTFSWCSGSSRISAKNRIYFKNEAEALATGRSLSKLCKK